MNYTLSNFTIAIRRLRCTVIFVTSSAPWTELNCSNSTNPKQKPCCRRKKENVNMIINKNQVRTKWKTLNWDRTLLLLTWIPSRLIGPNFLNSSSSCSTVASNGKFRTYMEWPSAVISISKTLHFHVNVNMSLWHRLRRTTKALFICFNKFLFAIHIKMSCSNELLKKYRYQHEHTHLPHEGYCFQEDCHHLLQKHRELEQV